MKLPATLTGTPVRLAAYALGLAVVFAAALGAGNAIGPRGVPAAGDTHAGEGGAGMPGGDGTHGASDPQGLSVTRDGYTLVPLAATLTAVPATGGTAAVPAATDFAFRITGPDGRAVTRYTPTHEKDLHLIVVRRDLAGFVHAHPTRDGDGTWRVGLPLPAGAGSYRVFADFQPAGLDRAITLGTDVSVPGSFTPLPLPGPAGTSTVDGYTVALDGTLHAGRGNAVTLTVSRDGAPVTDLQPYLGAYGHLVALRQGDLGYLHVHPEGAPGGGKTAAGPGLTFTVEVPTAGTYRLFLDFKHGESVHTAAFTVVATG